MKLNDILKKYFYNEHGKIILKFPFQNELDKVKKGYKFLIDNKIDIKYIKDYQYNYIKYTIITIKKTLNMEDYSIVNKRIDKIRLLAKYYLN